MKGKERRGEERRYEGGWEKGRRWQCLREQTSPPVWLPDRKEQTGGERRRTSRAVCVCECARRWSILPGGRRASVRLLSTQTVACGSCPCLPECCAATCYTCSAIMHQSSCLLPLCYLPLCPSVPVSVSLRGCMFLWQWALVPIVPVTLHGVTCSLCTLCTWHHSPSAPLRILNTDRWPGAVSQSKLLICCRGCPTSLHFPERYFQRTHILSNWAHTASSKHTAHPHWRAQKVMHLNAVMGMGGQRINWVHVLEHECARESLFNVYLDP